MIYGEPALRIEHDSTDRIGIRTMVLSQLWQPSQWRNDLAELEAAAPAVPVVPGGVYLVGHQNRPFGGALRTYWTFEGINGDGKSVTFKQRHNSLDYGFEPGFAQVPIELHRRFQQFLDQFGGWIIDGAVGFPPTLGDGSTEAVGLSGTKETKAPKNPMFGQTDFLRMEGTYHFRYAETTIAGALGGVGTIHESVALPGVPPSYPGRNWLKAPVAYQRRGPVFELIETYWLSGEEGWPEPLYGKNSGDGSNGLLWGLNLGSLSK